MTGFTGLAICNPAGLRFGISPHPLMTAGGLELGGGLVYPQRARPPRARI
jgi:hypothetical protein